MEMRRNRHIHFVNSSVSVSFDSQLAISLSHVTLHSLWACGVGLDRKYSTCLKLNRPHTTRESSKIQKLGLCSRSLEGRNQVQNWRNYPVVCKHITDAEIMSKPYWVLTGSCCFFISEEGECNTCMYWIFHVVWLFSLQPHVILNGCAILSVRWWIIRLRNQSETQWIIQAAFLLCKLESDGFITFQCSYKNPTWIPTARHNEHL